MDQEDKPECEGKMVFDSKAEAEAAALTADWQHGAILTPYLCKTCNLWHLTSN